LSSLSLGPERNVKCYNRYFVKGYVFHTEEYRHGRKTYNSGVCVKGSTSSELEVDYCGKLEEVVELQYHSEQNIVFLFKCYWYDTTDRGIRIDPHYGLVEINSKSRLRNINNVFVFAKQCQQVYYTYTPSFRNDRSKVDWLFILKTKPKVMSSLFRMRTKTQVCEIKTFKLVSWSNHIELLLRLTWKKIQIFMFSMIVLLMLMQRSWMLFWALADKQMLMKMMISILKVVMKVMTIQLTMMMKKIRTNYQNKALCKIFFHVIYIMDDIFCNMKYLFYKFMYCLSTVIIVLCDGQFSNKNNYLKCHHHRRRYRQTNFHRHFTKSWKIITSNATITDIDTDGQTSVGISQKITWNATIIDIDTDGF